MIRFINIYIKIICVYEIQSVKRRCLEKLLCYLNKGRKISIIIIFYNIWKRDFLKVTRAWLSYVKMVILILTITMYLTIKLKILWRLIKDTSNISLSLKYMKRYPKLWQLKKQMRMSYRIFELTPCYFDKKENKI